MSETRLTQEEIAEGRILVDALDALEREYAEVAHVPAWSDIRQDVVKRTFNATRAADKWTCRHIRLLLDTAEREAAQAAEIAACAPYLKDSETPAECIERNRKDIDAVLSLLATEKSERAALVNRLGQDIVQLQQRLDERTLQRDAFHQGRENVQQENVALTQERDALKDAVMHHLTVARVSFPKTPYRESLEQLRLLAPLPVAPRPSDGARSEDT